MKELFLKAIRGQLFVEALVRTRGLLILPIATRVLGPEGYGLIAFAAAITGLVGTLATLGLPAALARYLPARKTPAEQAEILWPALVSCAISVLGFGGLTVAVMSAFSLAPQGIPFALLVLAAGNMISAELKLLLFNFFRLTFELKRYYRFLILDVLVSGALQLLVLLVIDGDALAVIGSIIVADLVLLTFALAVIRGRLPWRRPSLKILRPLYRFGLPLSANPLLTWANNTADRFFIQAFLGSAVLGVYSVGYNLGFTVVGLIATPIFAVLPSVMFRAWDEGDREGVQRLLSRFTTILPLASLPGMLCLTFFGDPVIVLLAGEPFAGAQDYVFWVALGYLLMWVGDMYGYPLWLHHRQYLYSVCMLVSVGINLAANAVLVPAVGALGSAYATAGSLGLLAASLYLLNLGFGYARPPLIGPAGIGLAAAGCWILADQAWPVSPTILDTLVFSIVTTAGFLAIVYAVGLYPGKRGFAGLRRHVEAA